MSALRSLRLRLVAVLTGVVACAMGVVFLYVVPSLRQNLISDRLTGLEVIARHQQVAPGMTKAFQTGVHMRRALLRSARLANGQAGAYTLVDGKLTPVTVVNLAGARARRAPSCGRPRAAGSCPAGSCPGARPAAAWSWRSAWAATASCCCRRASAT